MKYVRTNMKDSSRIYVSHSLYLLQTTVVYDQQRARTVPNSLEKYFRTFISIIIIFIMKIEWALRRTDMVIP
jgi:hypothetical protein